MQVNPSGNISVTGSIPRPTNNNAVRPEGDQAEFVNSQTIDQALRDQPEVRPEAVAMAKGLVEDASYPPDETVRRLANLLALDFTQNSAS
jgi:hypothetical protein